jgi:hypothetical protein
MIFPEVLLVRVIMSLDGVFSDQNGEINTRHTAGTRVHHNFQVIPVLLS